jgi:PAS domain-containing protein
VGEAPAPEWTWFCGHCAAPSPTGLAPAPYARVCKECGLGLLLEAPLTSAPEPHEAFLVVDSSLHVQAVSRRAERLLAVSEEDVVSRPVSELLVAADADAHTPAALAEAIIGILGSDDSEGHSYVRPWNTFGVRMRVRIAPCGPPRAALLVVDVPPTLRLRSVEDD